MSTSADRTNHRGASQIAGREVSQVRHAPFLPLPQVGDQTQSRVTERPVAPLTASVCAGALLRSGAPLQAG